MTLTSLALAACHTLAAAQPAVLQSDDAATLGALKSALATALQRADVELGPVDLTRSPAVPVLPRPPASVEGRSTAMPIMFDIAMKDGACVLIRRDTGEAFSLGSISCRAL